MITVRVQVSAIYQVEVESLAQHSDYIEGKKSGEEKDVREQTTSIYAEAGDSTIYRHSDILHMNRTQLYKIRFLRLV